MTMPSPIRALDRHLNAGKRKAFPCPIKDTEDASVPPDLVIVNIESENAIFHAVTEIPKTLKQICQDIL